MTTTYANPANRGKGRGHKNVQFPLMAEHITAGIADDVHHCALAKALTGVLMGDARYGTVDLHSVTVKVDDSGRSGHQLIVWAAWDWTETVDGADVRRHCDAEIEPREAATWWACLNDIGSQARVKKMAAAHPVDGEWFTALDVHSRIVDTRTVGERRAKGHQHGNVKPQPQPREAPQEEGREVEVNFTATIPGRKMPPRRARRTSRRFGIR